jgi:hypothetical protein
MAVAHSDGEAGPTIKIRRRVEIADGVHDMVKTVRHRRGLLNDRRYFTEEKPVGANNWLTMLPTIWPSSSVFARAAIQSGSL